MLVFLLHVTAFLYLIKYSKRDGSIEVNESDGSIEVNENLLLMVPMIQLVWYDYYGSRFWAMALVCALGWYIVVVMVVQYGHWSISKRDNLNLYGVALRARHWIAALLVAGLYIGMYGAMEIVFLKEQTIIVAGLIAFLLGVMMLKNVNRRGYFTLINLASVVYLSLVFWWKAGQVAQWTEGFGDGRENLFVVFYNKSVVVECFILCWVMFVPLDVLKRLERE